MATTRSSDTLQKELKAKQICRFCLSQQHDKLASIYQRDTRLKSSAPLPVQVMACASIEVFSNDGMPCMVCNDCRLLFEHAYRFKQMCKRAEVLLRQFPLTGQWPSPLPKPKFPKELLSTTTNSTQQQQQQRHQNHQQQPQDRSIDQIKVSPPQQQSIQSISTKTSDLPLPRKKLLNADPAESPEPPVPPRLKKEKLDKETTSFLNKMENNEELSIDDVHRLMEATDNEQVEHTQNDQQQQQHQQQLSSQPHPKMTPTKTKPKLLNKSSIRILNKDAEIVLEPRLSAPQLKRDVDGNMAVVTEILDPDTVYDTEPDPVKDAAPIETVVFPCPHCERSFPLRQLRDIHMVNHTRSRSFQCQECEKSFFSKYDLQKHSLVHSGDRPYKCTVCDKGFTRATLLYRHERTHTDIPKFLCVYCEKPFISKEQMEKHSERHMKVRRYQCSVCKKSFAFKQGLERHEVVHSREQPYPCQYCDQSFSTPSKLARHLTAHAGKRPYPCKFCHKSYLLSHHLTRHLRSHKYGTVAFMCSDCDKVFKTRDELIYHSAVHATQTLVCPLCKERFEDIQSVTLHIKEHADGEAFACEFCDLIFMTGERLQYHTESDHAGDIAAYRENDEQMQRLQSDSFKQEITNNKIDDGNSTENLRILEETIEEFLVDELPDEANNKTVPIQNIKEENEWVNQNNEQPQILDQIVLQTNMNIDENILVLNENIVEANEEFVSVEYNPPQQQSPTKIRKLATRQSQQITKSVSPQKDKSGERRRKVAEISPPISTNKIKIELDDDIIEEQKPSKMSRTSNAISSTSNTAINSVLKMLPKSVSVRRNHPSNSEVNSNEKLLTKRSPQFQEETRRNNRRKSNESTTSRIAKRLSSSSEKSPGLHDKSPDKKQIATASTISPNNSSHKAHEKTKTMKIMMGEKKVKVQKITITKAEAVAMAKDGRIRIKDGNMVLSKMPKTE